MHELETIREIHRVTRAQTGDHDAFLELVEAYERKLLYFLRRFERDPHNALDALQEVWFTAWKKLGSLRNPAAFRVWIYRIAHGVVVDAIRTEQRRREVEHEGAERATPLKSQGERIVDAADMVHYALEQLSPEYREIVALRFLEDMTMDEIADATETRVGTVKSRLHAAKEMMQKIIEEQNHGN